VTLLTLVPFTVDVADDILAGRRGSNWAEDYPTDGDLEVADRMRSGQWTIDANGSPWHPWQIVDDERGIVVGGIGFHGPPDERGSVEIGYGVAATGQGRGIATNAVGLIVELARRFGARTVVAGTDPGNLASQRVLEKCGFVRTEPEGEELRWALPVSPAHDTPREMGLAEGRQPDDR
jgi:[ribosomal protein S5]-alanine N-acetyltransferase